jgi:hypothetical protein
MLQSVRSKLSKVSVILSVWLVSCGPATTVQKPETAKVGIPQSNPTNCPPPKVKGQPEFCQAGTALYVVGLAPGQGIDRGERMLLEGALDDIGLKGLVGIVAVMESGPDFTRSRRGQARTIELSALIQTM